MCLGGGRGGGALRWKENAQIEQEMPKRKEDSASAIPTVRVKFYLACIHKCDEGDDHHWEAYHLANNLKAVLKNFANSFRQQRKHLKDSVHFFCVGLTSTQWGQQEIKFEGKGCRMWRTKFGVA